ncbi:VOC family protein [Agriterribacter sp.]|uniref:VOC family protein n=1 Tax=Agriterribacter sp. TaxID=2821509 RepID=UPI002C3016ED|nr:VOC family protein [Agriterribacter sp.]HTN06040.1 VOC family protein [Agriterribacter sp.]
MMEDPVRLVIRSIQHIGIPVSSLPVSEAFYNRLGFTNVMQAAFMHNGNSGTCVMMKRDNMIIELYQLPGSELENIRNRKDGHIDHVAFDVPDINEAFAALKRGGYTIMEEAPVFLNFWQNGCKYFNIVGPDGERLEFNQIL